MKICPSCKCGTTGRPEACPACGANLGDVRERAGTDLVGMVIDGKYQLTELVGEGAMGWVYAGVHLSLESTIAVKLMKPSSDDGDTRDARFQREARAASRLNSPHIISIIDFGSTPGGLLYIVSEFLRGTTLSELILAEGTLALERAIRIMDQVLTAIDEAHESGLVHRDLKPENIIITPLRSGEDFVKVLDFGIAKIADPGGKRLTLQGQLFGTPAYMAPEQIRGQEATAQSDIYACGLILFEMLTGREAFPSSSVMEVLAAQLGEEPPLLREASPRGEELPEALEQLVSRCVEKRPEKRYESAHQLRKALHRAVGFRKGYSAATGGVPTVTCEHCGQPVFGTGRFCSECGAPLSSEETVEAPPAPETAHRRRGTQPWAGHAVTLKARLVESAADGAPVDPFPRASSDEFLTAHSTLNRRLRAEQTLRFQLVDRESELGDLTAIFDSEDGVAEILGEQGTGRTRLLEAVHGVAERRGLHVFRAGPDPRLSRTPWYPVQRLVADMLELDPDRPVRYETLRDRALECGLLADDLLGLAVLFGVESREGPVELAVRRRETRSAALRALLRSSAARQGICLLLDDADEFDAASQAFLREYLNQEPVGPRYLVVTGEHSVLADEIDRLVVQPSRFGLREIEQLMRQALDLKGASWPTLLETIGSRSDGNVLHATQAVRLLAEGGTEVGESLPDLLQTRIGRLPSDALRLLQMICILGREASREHVARLYQDDELLDRALQLLYRRGLVESVRETRFRVAHACYADTVREMMPADARQQLHRRALAVLTTAGEDSFSLARHAAEARDGANSLAVLRQAGQDSEQRLDDHGAARHYRRALHMARWELLYEETDEQCLDLALHLGDTLHFIGDLQAAELVLKEALTYAEQRPGMEAQLLRSLARVQVSQDRVEEAMGTFREALRLGLMAGDRELLAELYINLGKTLANRQQWQAAVAEMSEGVDLVTAGEGPGAEDTPACFWRLLVQLAECQIENGGLKPAVELAAAALQQARRHDSGVGKARCHFVLSRVLDLQRNTEAAERHHAAAVQAFRQLGDRQSAAECLLTRAARCPNRSQDIIQQALSLSKQVAWEQGILKASSLLAVS